MTMMLIALAGGLGAVTRFVVDALIARHNPFSLPLGTFVINVTGSLLLGLLTGLALAQPDGLAPHLKAVLGTGFCGGYTTFSTAAVEGVRLWTAEGRLRGIVYAGGSMLVCSLAAGLGLLLV